MNVKEKTLLDKFLNGTATAQEKLLIKNWYNHEAGLPKNSLPKLDYELVKQEIWQSIQQNKIQKPFRKTGLTILKVAALFVLVCTAAFFCLIKTTKPPIIVKVIKPIDIAPGGNKATLTLANGQQISLDNAKNGTLATQGVIFINKTQEGELRYKVNKLQTQNAAIQYNTVTTPRGGQYQVILSDGTQVWLNSVSSIHFPTVFNADERNVEITGEAYFDVAKDKNHPFNVIANGQKITVLGTQFNINTYQEERVLKTTLLEGSIKIRNQNSAVILKPGQQAQIRLSNPKLIYIVPNADTEQAIAWKDGFFRIENADIRTIMRQAARWYDVEVVYDGQIPKKQFTGEIRRNVNISKFIEMLTYFNLHFKLEGRKIIVHQ